MGREKNGRGEGDGEEKGREKGREGKGGERIGVGRKVEGRETNIAKLN